MAPKGPRHHFLPIFYLKQWMNPQNRIYEFKRGYDGKVRARPTHPSGTGYVRGLYSMPGITDPVRREAIEQNFMQPVDSRAADLLDDMKNERRTFNNVEKRSAWTRFLVSILMRNPEEVELCKKYYAASWMESSESRQREYAKRRVPGLPPTLTEFLQTIDPIRIEQLAMETFVQLMDSPNIGSFMNGMRWGSIRLPIRAPALLTSDRPLIMSDGLRGVDGHLVLPIGPKRVFYAVNNLNAEYRMANMEPVAFARRVNDIVVSQAAHCVYGTYDIGRDHLEQRLNKTPLVSFMDKMQQHKPTANIDF